MKRFILFTFSVLLTFTFAIAQNSNFTYVPDDNFEQALINLGYDNVLDDYVITANINTVTYLNVSFSNIVDLTGIEDFTALTSLHCQFVGAIKRLTYLIAKKRTKQRSGGAGGHLTGTLTELRAGDGTRHASQQSSHAFLLAGTR